MSGNSKCHKAKSNGLENRVNGVAKRKWHLSWTLTEFLNEVKGSAKQICRRITFLVEGTVITKAWTVVYLEGPGASPRGRWSGLCSGGGGGKEIREATRGQAVPWLKGHCKNSVFYLDAMGDWAVFHRQRSVEGFGAKVEQSIMMWTIF